MLTRRFLNSWIFIFSLYILHQSNLKLFRGFNHHLNADDSHSCKQFKCLLTSPEFHIQLIKLGKENTERSHWLLKFLPTSDTLPFPFNSSSQVTAPCVTLACAWKKREDQNSPPMATITPNLFLLHVAEVSSAPQHSHSIHSVAKSLLAHDSFLLIPHMQSFVNPWRSSFYKYLDCSPCHVHATYLVQITAISYLN